MWSWRGLLVVIFVAGLLSLPILKYRNFLTRGLRPPESTQMLDGMEKNGVPEFTLPGQDGRDHSLAQYKGKIIVLNFWASWCAPCVKEFPSLKNLVNHFNGEVVVLAVSHDKTHDDLYSFMNAFGQVPGGFHVLWDKDRSVGRSYGTQVLPESFIIGRDLKLIRKVAGVDEWDSPGAIRFFEEALKTP